MENQRFPIDVTEQEMTEIEQLVAFTGVKTKGELIQNALMLYRWAANELLHGRVIASTDRAGGNIQPLEIPQLSSYAQTIEQVRMVLPSEAELEERAIKPGRSLREVLDEVARKMDDAPEKSNNQPRGRKKVG